MLLALLSFSGRQWLWPVLIFWIAAAASLTFGYRPGPARLGLRVLAASLKMAGFLLIGLCLLEPVWIGTRARPGANTFILLADNSQGMQIHDAGRHQSRGEWLRGLLDSRSSSWQSDLESQFRVHRYLFDSRLESSESFGGLNFSGRSSAMGVALQTIKDRYKGQPLAGILLFTDGNATDLGADGMDPRGLPPIYPIVVGNDDALKDISLQNVAVSQTAFEDAPVAITAEVGVSGYPGAAIGAQLLDPAGKIVATQSQRETRRDEPLVFRFRLRPAKEGVSFYSIRTGPDDELKTFDRRAVSSEATLLNNERVVAIDRGKGPYRLLYVAGRPGWDYKFLNRALAEDPQLDLVALIRIARREPKFEFKGRQGESSNPLFRGFDRTTEETERYDKPVLVRLNPKDEIELRGGFPKTAEELYPFHAVILDDLESEFFSRDQMGLLQRFVSERGGGFLMLGGADSLGEGNFARTPIADLMPVYLERFPKPAGEVHWSLTREGWLQPWARLRDNENDEHRRLEAMRGFEVWNRVGGIKPGATVIATVSDARSNQYPALVAQRYGNGRTAALAIGDMWHWSLGDEELQKDLGKAWRQFIRWLIADVPAPVEVAAAKKTGDPNEAMLIQVRARNEKFEPLDNATVTLKISSFTPPSTAGKPRALAPGRPLGDKALIIPAEAAASQPGLYEALFIPRETGGYQVEAFVTNSVGVEAGRAVTGWTTDIAAEEFRSLRPNRALLQNLAQKTGGEIVEPGRLDQFVKSLPHRAVPIREAWTVPVWHQPLFFLLALSAFFLEWGLRRSKGLA